MQDSDTQEERMNITAALKRRQVEALRASAEKEDRSVSSFLRMIVDRFYGFDKATIDPRESEQERVA